MADTAEYLSEIGELVAGLRDLHLEPILVGGMALVVLGSRRVTRDFDFVITHPGDRLTETIDLLYSRGLELVSRIDATGERISTISSRKVASIRLRIDAPATAYFFNAKTGLRVDLLFDFPIPAAELAAHATRIKTQSHVLDVASEQDLLRLKLIAKAARSTPGDAEDIAFLEARRKGQA